MKLSYQVVSVDRKKKYFHITCLLLAYYMLFIFTNHAAQNKKNITNNTVGLEIVQKQNKKI